MSLHHDMISFFRMLNGVRFDAVARYKTDQTFGRHVKKHHSGQDADELRIEPILRLPSVQRPSPPKRASKVDSMKGPSAGPSLAPSLPHSKARVSYEAEEVDELESEEETEVNGIPPVTVLKSSKGVKRPRELTPPLPNSEQQSTLLTPFIQEETAIKRSRARTIPSQLPWNERLSGLPASRLQGYTFVHQSGTPPAPTPTLTTATESRATCYPGSPPSSAIPYATSGAMNRSDSESCLLSVPPREGSTFTSRARSNTAPDAPSDSLRLPTDITSTSPLSLRVLPPPITVPHEQVITPRPYGTLWRSANQDSSREGTPGGWSPATGSSMNSPVSGSSDLGEDGRGHHSSASSWKELPTGFTDNFSKWTTAHAQETRLLYDPSEAAAAGAGTYITPVTQFPSSTRMSSDPGAFPGIETFDRRRSASRNEQRPSEHFSHRRTASNT